MRRARWDVGLGVALLCGLFGLAMGRATLLAAGVVGVTYAVYGAVAGQPGGPVAVTREVSAAEPAPGSTVRVTVEVENVGDEPVPEVRVVDAPPSDLPLVEGSIAHATSLAAGETADFEYVLRARRGRHEFGAARLLLRNVAGSVERTEQAAGGTTLSCRAPVQSFPLAGQTTPYDGRVETDAHGEGVAFHSVREFHPADPLSRIDWKRYARTRELTTVLFRETRAATVVIVVDVRPEARVARQAGGPDGKALSAYAAGHLAGVLLSAHNRVGAATFGRQEYLQPGVGRDQALRVRGFLAETVERTNADGEGESSVVDTRAGVFGMDDPAVRSDGGATSETSGTSSDLRSDGGPASETRGTSSDLRSDGGWEFDRLRRRLPDDAQVLFCSPLVDDRAETVADLLAAHGHETTVVSPDVTTTDSHGGAVERLKRRRRMQSLRPAVRVVDWSPDDPLATAVDRAERRWSR